MLRCGTDRLIRTFVRELREKLSRSDEEVQVLAEAVVERAWREAVDPGDRDPRLVPRDPEVRAAGEHARRVLAARLRKTRNLPALVFLIPIEHLRARAGRVRSQVASVAGAYSGAALVPALSNWLIAAAVVGVLAAGSAFTAAGAGDLSPVAYRADQPPSDLTRDTRAPHGLARVPSSTASGSHAALGFAVSAPDLHPAGPSIRAGGDAGVDEDRHLVIDAEMLYQFSPLKERIIEGPIFWASCTSVKAVVCDAVEGTERLAGSHEGGDPR